jgi:predicted component of type VI protein secretion system
MDPAVIKQINQRVQEELRKKEIEVVQYGLMELERIMGKRHQDLSGLQSELQGLIRKYQNRLKVLKTSD